MSTRLSALLSSLNRFRSTASPTGGRNKQGRYQPPEVLENRIAPAAGLTVVKTAAFAPGGDVNGDGNFDPGDTIFYTVTLTNSGTVDLTGVTFADIVDSNTTIGTNINVSPLAFNDTFTAVANTLLEVGVTHGASPAAQVAGSVTANDTEFLSDTFTLSKLQAVSFSAGTATASSAQGGSVTMNTSGNFSYLPAVGFTGTDTFTYTITDKGFDGVAGNGDDLTSVATVTVTVGAQKVWYVDSSFAGTSDGRSTNPFKTLAPLNVTATDPDGAGDMIYVHTGTSATTPYTGGITLEATQTLHGQGEILQVGGFTLNAAGTAPKFTNVGGTTVALATGNTLKGVTLGDSNIDISGTSFGTLTITNTVSLNGTGKALDLTTGTISATLADLTVTSSATEGIKLTGVDGTLTANTGSLAGITGDDIFISGGAATITLGISDTNTAGHSVNIASKTGGVVNLNGSINDTGTGIQLTTNTGATIHFTGGIVASTTTNKAFSATGGGIIDVTGANNTLTTTTGIALEVQNTTISGTGLTFKSIASNGAASGILLNTTGAGGLTVTGDATTAANGSGGVITGSTGAGISLTSAQNISLDQMNIQNGGNDGITGTTVTNFTLSRSNITSNGNADEEHGIEFANVFGAVAISDTVVRGSFEHNFKITNTSGTIDTLNIKNSTFDHASIPVSPAGGNGVLITMQQTAILTKGSISGSTFRNNFSNGILVNTENTSRIGDDNAVGSSTNGFVVSGNTFDDNNIAIQFGQFNSSDLTVDIQGNTIVNDGRVATSGTNSTSHAIVVGSSAIAGAGSSLNARIDSNIIGNAGIAGSGSSIGSGIRVIVQGLTDGTILVNNNTIRQAPSGFGMELTFLGPQDDLGTVPTSDVTVTNNNVDHRNLGFAPGSSDFPLPAIYIAGDNQGGAPAAPPVRADVRGNVVPTSGTSFNFLGTWIEVFEYNGTSAGNLSLVDNGTASANGTAELQSQNTGTASANAGVALITGAITTPPDLTPLPLIFAPGADDVIIAPTVIGVQPVTPPVIDGGTPVVPPPVIVDDGILSQAELDSLVGAAIARWEATGLTPAQVDLLHHVTFSVRDLPAWYLGEASAGHVTLDSNAAGNSWFIDATPNDDSEFAGSHATATGGAAGRIDALTTVMHELGHQLGLDDSYVSSDSGNLMYGYIHQSERRLPTSHAADGATPHLTAGEFDFATLPVTIGNLPIGQNVKVQFAAAIKDTIAVNTVSNTGTGSSTETGNVSSNTVVTPVDLPDVQVVMTTATASETTGALVYTFLRDGITTAPLTVNFGATGTAILADYTATSSGTLNFGAGTVVIPIGSNSVTVTLTPNNDRLVEGNETATLTVAAGGYDIVGSPATGTINDNDTATLSFTTGTSSGLESVGTQNISTTLTISATGTGTIGLASNFTANLTSTGGTATGSGTDYTLPGSPAVTFTTADDFSGGSVTKNAAVTINDDRQVEGDETAQFGLAIVQNIGTQVSIGGTTSHTLTITDNDTATLSFTAGTSTALESVVTQNVNATLTINAIGTGTIGLAGNLTANLTTTGGTATGSGTDYTLPGSPALTFLAGTYATGIGTQNAAVTVTEDRQVEGSETAQLGLAIVSNIGTQVSIGGTTAHTLTLTDNDTATLGFTTGTSTALETAGTQNISTTLTINSIGTGTIGLASNLTANLTTTGGTATGSGTDYTLPGSPAVTFLAGTYATGTGTQLGAITVNDDRQVEGDETAVLGLSIVGNIGTQVSIGGTTAHTLTLTDNDSATLSFTTGSSTAQESAGTQSISTTLTINAIGTGTIGLASNLTANLTTQAGGAATGGGVDYTLPTSPAFTFLAGTYATGSGTQSASVSLVNDGTPEGSETANLGLAIVQNIGTQGSVGGTTTHVLTIQDTNVSVALLSGTSALESSAGLVYTFTRTGDNSSALPITFSKAGSAIFGTDFTATSSAGTFDYAAGTLTIPAGSFTATVTLVPTDDAIVEANETAILTVAAGAGYGIGGSPATGTITDNDTATVSIAKISDGAETNTPTNGKFRVTQTAVSSVDTVVSYTIGGTATGGSDFTSLTGTVTILAGNTTADIDVLVLNDAIVEGTETVIATLTNVTAGNTGVSLSGTPANLTSTLSITDNDTATVSIAKLLDGAETNTPTNGTFRVTQTAVSSTDTVVNYTIGGTATAGSDFTALSGTVTILAGQTTADIGVPVLNDAIVEGTETVSVTLASFGAHDADITLDATPANLTASLNITDNDIATVSIAKLLDGAETNTPTNGSFRVTQTAVSSTDTVVNYTIGGTATSGSDFTALSGTVTILAGQTTADIIVPVLNDAIVEGTETVSVTLTSFGAHDADITLISTPANLTASLSVTDNDTATVSIAKLLDGAETNTPTNASFRVTQSAVSSTDTVVNYTIGGTATSGSDFTALSGTVTILAGQTTADIVVPVLNDAIVEGTETVSVTLTSFGAHDADITLDATPANLTANLNITDNDTATVSIAKLLDGAETNTPTNGSFRVTQTAVSSTDTVVNYTIGGTATSGSDFTALTGTVTILAGQTTADIVVPVLNDAIVEGTETVSVTLTSFGAHDADITLDATPANLTASVNVTDNDTATVSIAKLLDGAETNTPTNGSFRVTQTAVSSTDTVVNYTIGGTATSGSDFTALSGTVTILAGQTTADIIVPVLNDAMVEGTETVSATLTSFGAHDADITLNGTPANLTASLSITDDDTATVTIAKLLDGAETNTPTNGSFRVTQSAVSSTDTVVNYTIGGTATSGSDFTALTGTVTILAGQTTADINVPVLNDSLVELTETVTATLTTLGAHDPKITLGATLNASLDITDDDTATVTITKVLDGAETNTPTAGKFRVMLTAVSTTDTVVSYTIGGTALSGSDFTALSGTVTIVANQTTADIDVTVLNDAIVEGTETVIATLGAVTAGNSHISVGGTNSATVDITDNDTATITIAKVTDASEAGSVNGKLRVTQSAVSSTDTVISYGLGSGTAMPGSDYTALSGTVTILAGQTTADIDIVVINDQSVEGPESVAVFANNITAGDPQITLGAQFGDTVTINDNDVATIGFVSPTSGVTEGAHDLIGVQLLIQAEGTGTPVLERAVSFNLTRNGGSATVNADYFLPSLITFGGGTHSGDVMQADVISFNDTDVENVETADFGLSILSVATNLPPAQATVATDGTGAHTMSITDNDVDLAVTGTTVSVTPVVAGSGPNNLTYTFKVQNNGFIDATNVTLDEAFTLPAGTTFSSYSTTDGSTFSGTDLGGTWTIPTVAAQGFATITVVFTAGSSTAHNSTATTVGVVGTADQSIVNGGDDSALETANIIRQNDLSVSISDAPDPAGPNTDLVYTITVANVGPSDSTTAHIVDHFPAGLTGITWTADFSNNGGTGTVNGSGDISEMLSVPAGGSVVYTVHATPGSGLAGTTISNSASISSSEDTATGNDSDTESTFIGGVDLKLTKTADSASRVPGQVIKYTLSYRNGGFVTAEGVSLSDLVPANTEFDLANSTAGWLDMLGNPLANNAVAGTPALFNVGSLAVSNTDATVVFAVHVKSTVSFGAGKIDNNASIGDDAASGPDVTPGDNTASTSVQLDAAADMKLLSTADKSLIIRGQTLHTTYTYSNVGNQDASGVSIMATVPVGTTFNAGESAAGWLPLDATHYAYSLGALVTADPTGATVGTVIFAVDVNTTRVTGLHQVNTTATVDEGVLMVGDNGDAPSTFNNTANNSAAPTKIYEGIYAVSQGIAVAGKFGTPTVHVYDPVTGEQLYQFDAYESKYRDSIRVAVADINGDGFDDIITTTGKGTGRLRVFDGLNGTWLHDDTNYTGAFKNEIAIFSGKGLEKGAFVAAGDLTGDGRADIIVGSALGAGKVKVLNGLTGVAVSFGAYDYFQPFGKTFRGGVRVAVGDLLGDGSNDLVTAMGYYGSNVKVYDGDSLAGFKPTVVAAPPTFNPTAAIDFKVGAKTYRGGVSVALGDLDGDNKQDLIVGRNYGRPTLVEAFSGIIKDINNNPAAIGAAINPFDVNPARPLYALGVRVAAIDIDFDGVADIIAASGGNNKSKVNIYSGADHHLIRTFTAIPNTPNSSLFAAGTSVSPVYHPVMAP